MRKDIRDFQRIKKQYSPSSILVITIVGIVMAEVVSMIFVYFIRDQSYVLQTTLDAAIMTVIIFPLLYFLSFRPLLLHIQQREKSESIIQTRLNLIQFAYAHALDELLQYTLDKIEDLSGSTIGFFHFLDADQKTIRLKVWSTHTMESMCQAEGKDSHYDVEQAGVWADAIRHRQSIIHNNYPELPYRKGLPDGHAPVHRELVVPVLRNDKVVAILGVGNKPQDYTPDDVELVYTITDFAWDVINDKLAENALRQSEEKFRTFVDWTYDWEKWIDSRGNLIYTSPSCERVTGFKPEEFMADPDLMMRIIHPADQPDYQEHQQIIHHDSLGPTSIEYRLIARDGSEHWIEHICRPVYGLDKSYLGRRVSNRDITKRKLAEKMIAEQNRRELILRETINSIQTDIARDLHDTLGQNISFLRMNLEHLSEAKWSDPVHVKGQIQHMAKTANESYELIRAMLSILQTGNSTDPLYLFTRYAEQISKRSSIKIDVISQGHPKQLIPDQIRQLFYIFREALSNVEKYANADSVTAEFCWGDQDLTLEIMDNGRGFDPDTILNDDHYGLKFMRERTELLNGYFSYDSALGRGTKITLVAPYEVDLPTQPP